MVRVAFATMLIGAGCRFGFEPLDGSDSSGVGPSRTVSVSIVGEGAVISEPAGLACFGNCSATLAGDVVLTAHALDGWEVASWSSESSGCTGTSCTLTGSDASDVVLAFRRAAIITNRAFVTSGQFDGNLGGRTGADGLCQTYADSASLGGTFRALLATSTETATQSFSGSRGWVRFDGAPVADLVADLVALKLDFPVLFDETGAIDGGKAWTGVTNIAAASTDSCLDWTSPMSGMMSKVGATDQIGLNAVSDTGMPLCSSTHSLYCFETGGVTPAPAIVRIPIGRYLFTTQSQLTLGGGIAAADALCTSEAAAAGLPGEYMAMMATSTQSIRDRLGSLMGPWRRPDDVVVAVADLANATQFRAPIHGTPTGALSVHTIWLGASGGNALTTLGTQTCGDWTLTTGTGLEGTNDNVRINQLFGGNSRPCSSPARVICLQR
jgi:hypothetical protein